MNLRCAQILKEGILLYVGAGITSDSDPEKEWEETQNKAKTESSNRKMDPTLREN